MWLSCLGMRRQIVINMTTQANTFFPPCLVCFDLAVWPSEVQRQGEPEGEREREGRLFGPEENHQTNNFVKFCSFFSGAAEASLDCHMYKGSPYKAFHGAEWTRHLWGFLISSPLFFSSFFKPCNQIWAKSNGGRIQREQWRRGGGVQWKYLLLFWNEQVIYKMPSFCTGG